MKFQSRKAVKVMAVVSVEYIVPVTKEERRNWTDYMDINKQLTRYADECSPVIVYNIKGFETKRDVMPHNRLSQDEVAMLWEEEKNALEYLFNA